MQMNKHLSFVLTKFFLYIGRLVVMTQNKLILLLGVAVVCMLGWIGLKVSNPVINYSTTVVENKPANPTHGLFQAGVSMTAN